MNDVKSFTIYKEYYELITLLTEKEQQELLLAITKFMFEDVEPSLNDKQTKIFNNLRRPLEKSKKRSKSGSTTETNNNQKENKIKSKQNQNEIKKGTKQNQKENEKETHQDVNVNVIVNDNVLESNKGVIGGKEKTFKKPTVEEIRDYCLKRENKIRAEQFYDFYESKGWKVGNQKMKDWKACVRTWEAREKKDKPKEEKLPEWFGKENIEKKLNENEEKELKELIESYE